MTDEDQQSATRERTRRAILTAGISTLTRRPAASMGDVADQAEVARSTLHRYYPDRAALLAGIAAYVAAEYDAALDRAHITEGTGMEALERLVDELLENLHVFTWWIYAEGAEDASPVEAETRTSELIARGHADGTIDATMPADWLLSMMWCAMYAVADTPSPLDGQRPRTPREARQLALHSLIKLARAV